MTGTITSVTTVQLGEGSLQANSFMAIQLTGTFSATVEFEGTIDGSTWFDVAVLPYGSLYDPTDAVTSATAVGAWRLDASGLQNVRLNCSTYTSGTVTYTVHTVTG